MCRRVLPSVTGIPADHAESAAPVSVVATGAVSYVRNGGRQVARDVSGGGVMLAAVDGHPPPRVVGVVA